MRCLGATDAPTHPCFPLCSTQQGVDGNAAHGPAKPFFAEAAVPKAKVIFTQMLAGRVEAHVGEVKVRLPVPCSSVRACALRDILFWPRVSSSVLFVFFSSFPVSIIFHQFLSCCFSHNSEVKVACVRVLRVCSR